MQRKRTFQLQSNGPFLPIPKYRKPPDLVIRSSWTVDYTVTLWAPFPFPVPLTELPALVPMPYCSTNALWWCSRQLVGGVTRPSVRPA